MEMDANWAHHVIETDNSNSAFLRFKCDCVEAEAEMPLAARKSPLY